jgi:hypothetical protein
MATGPGGVARTRLPPATIFQPFGLPQVNLLTPTCRVAAAIGIESLTRIAQAARPHLTWETRGPRLAAQGLISCEVIEFSSGL